MINKKLIMTMAICTVLLTGKSIAVGTSNDLLRMDVKKSSSADTVDVTFYTTGENHNSVVSRKSGNSYVVLLPNVSGSQSVVPSLGGVKDLVSNVTVKTIDDGIGGYTKITFDTTKPIKIQTYSKQTAPLTQAQQDYKALIAQNNTIKAVHNAQATQTSKPVNQTKPATQVKNTVSQPAKPAANAKTSVNSNSVQPKTPVPVAKTNTANTVSAKPISKTETKTTNQKNTVKTETQKPQQVVKSAEKANEIVSQEEANIKPQETEAETLQAVEPVAGDNKSEVQQPVVPVTNKVTIKQKFKNKIKNSKYNTPIVPIAGAFCVFGLFLLFGLSGIITRGVEDKRNRLKEYLDSNENSQQPVPKANEEFQEIMEDKTTNWQERYKRYADVNDKRRKIKSSDNMSYVADVSSSKGVIIPENLSKKQMEETVSRMEHSLSQTPNYDEPLYDMSDLWNSEDDVITDTMSKVKLKSFAKSVNLTQTGRNLVSFEELEHRRKTLEENQFVNMEKSPLHMSKRKSLSSGMNFSDIVRGNDNINTNDVEISEERKQKDYILSSINEYMNILDTEKSEPVEASPVISNPLELENAKDISMALKNAEIELTNAKNLVTNPMNSQRKSPFQNRPQTNPNGLTIRSNYKIDSNKSIYMVDLDDTTSIIGKIGDEIFVLKKFDRIINKSMQVRHDYGTTYIVRVGTFKCLVDVTEEKMGTLLEI